MFKIKRLIPEYVTQTPKRKDTNTFTLTEEGKKLAMRDESANE